MAKLPIIYAVHINATVHLISKKKIHDGVPVTWLYIMVKKLTLFSVLYLFYDIIWRFSGLIFEIDIEQYRYMSIGVWYWK